MSDDDLGFFIDDPGDEDYDEDYGSDEEGVRDLGEGFGEYDPMEQKYGFSIKDIERAGIGDAGIGIGDPRRDEPEDMFRRILQAKGLNLIEDHSIMSQKDLTDVIELSRDDKIKDDIKHLNAKAFLLGFLANRVDKKDNIRYVINTVLPIVDERKNDITPPDVIRYYKFIKKLKSNI